MKTVKHWLHILLTVLTSGLWLPIYVILLATTEMYNRGYKVGKAAGRVEKSNEYEAACAQPQVAWVTPPDARTLNCRCVPTPIVEAGPVVVTNVKSGDDFVVNSKSRVDRFAELADRNRKVGLDQYERAEYIQLREALSK